MVALLQPRWDPVVNTRHGSAKPHIVSHTKAKKTDIVYLDAEILSPAHMFTSFCFKRH